MQEMLKEVQYCQKTIATKFKKPLKMSDKDEQHFQEASECHICNRPYTDKDIRVRDHTHVQYSRLDSSGQNLESNGVWSKNETGSTVEMKMKPEV